MHRVHGLYFEKKGPRALAPDLQLNVRTSLRRLKH